MTHPAALTRILETIALQGDLPSSANFRPFAMKTRHRLLCSPAGSDELIRVASLADQALKVAITRHSDKPQPIVAQLNPVHMPSFVCTGQSVCDGNFSGNRAAPRPKQQHEPSKRRNSYGA